MHNNSSSQQLVTKPSQTIESSEPLILQTSDYTPNSSRVFNHSIRNTTTLNSGSAKTTILKKGEALPISAARAPG
jgi:hypothetical protein